MYVVVVFSLRMISFGVFVCCYDTYASWVRLGCAVLGYYLSIVDQVVYISSLLLLYDSLLVNVALTSLSLPTSLVTILSYAFYSCSDLPTVIIPT
jgi:hypothetical protein